MSWTITTREDRRYTHRIQVRDENEALVLDVLAAGCWPEDGQIFCRRADPSEALGPIVEFAPTQRVERQGKTLNITLDRQSQNQCAFTTLQRNYKNKPGTYEQIFFRVPSQTRSHEKPRAPTRPTILVDSQERNAWQFEDSRVAPLDVGSYALRQNGQTLAAVERRNLRNLLGELTRLSGFHTRIRKLHVVPHRAVVIEATFADLANPAKIAPYKGTQVWKALSDLQVAHPDVPFLLLGNRKSANLWAEMFFSGAFKKYQRTGAATTGESGLSDEAIEQNLLGRRAVKTRETAQELHTTTERVLRTLNRLKARQMARYDPDHDGGCWIIQHAKHTEN